MRQHDRDALIYFARGCTSGEWKIGVSYDPAERVATLASERREDIELRATVPGTRDDERATLARFAHLAAPGQREWFVDDGTIAAHVESLPAERRGSYVRPYRGPRVTRPRDVIEAERAAQMAAWRADYRAVHGHEYRLGHRGEGCAVCAREAERAAEFAKTLRAQLRPAPSPRQAPKRRPSTVIPPAFAVGRWSSAWPEVAS